MLLFFQDSSVTIPGLDALAQYGALGAMLAYFLFKDYTAFNKLHKLADKVSDTLAAAIEEKEERYQIRKRVDNSEERLTRLEAKSTL